MSPKEKFLETLDREHAITLKILRAFPADQLDLKPSERSNSARQLMWTFVMERGLGLRVWNDEFANGMPKGATPPPPPDTHEGLLEALHKAHADYRAVIANASEEELHQKVHFFTAPKTMGEITRLDWVWFLLHDEIHHRGQLTVYVRMAGAKLPSIYGPSGDEPWI